MHIIFYFFTGEDQDDLIPSARAVDGSKESDLLSCYLCELDEELAMYVLYNLKNEIVDKIDISSESWGVIIDFDKVNLYFLYDEDNIEYKTSINISEFKEGIEQWVNFLQIPAKESFEMDIVL